MTWYIINFTKCKCKNNLINEWGLFQLDFLENNSCDYRNVELRTNKLFEAILDILLFIGLY